MVQAIQEYDLYDRVIVSSFNPVALLRVKWADKRIPVGLIYAPDLPRYLSEGWFVPILRPEALHPEIRMVDEEYMEKARKKGYRVNVITDRPDQLLLQMQELGMIN